MKRNALLPAWLGLTGAGAWLIARPDDNRRLLTFSEAHGLALADAAGALLLVAAFLLLLLSIARRRRRIAARLRERPAGLGVLSFLAGVGLGLLIASVFTDFWWWWLIGAVLLQLFWFALWVAGAEPS
ncbi:MAG: hypothetical protein ACOY93_05830 [Bacillota bacterium]